MAKTIDLTELIEWGSAFGSAKQPDGSLLVVDLTEADWSLVEAAAQVLDHVGAVKVGVSESPLPGEASPLLERMTTTVAPGGPGVAWVDAGRSAVDDIAGSVRRNPRAATVLDHVMRLVNQVGVQDGVVIESLAYSMLLASEEFARWRSSTPRRDRHGISSPVLLERHGKTLRVVLNQPERRNAFGRAMRDGLLEGLALAERDATISKVELSGAGPAFCSGGDLDEFGTATDVAEAHSVRLAAHAGLAVHRLADRVTAHLHGACIGAGIEIAAFAARVVANEGTWFQLPELSMGLIPGAGGTVSISRRIGPWRTSYLALSGRRLELESALAWGLVDGRE